jgi:hypothetical protein
MTTEAVVEVRIADHGKVRALCDGAAVALGRFADLSDEERAALPLPACDGIEALAAACAAALGEDAPPPLRDLRPYGSIIIEWAPPRGAGRPMPGWDTKVYDTATGDEIGSSVLRIRLIDVDASKALTADLTMFADEDGRLATEPHVRDGDVITGVFRFNVSEMRVRS